jgi:hypothetical protein
MSFTPRYELSHACQRTVRIVVHLPWLALEGAMVDAVQMDALHHRGLFDAQSRNLTRKSRADISTEDVVDSPPVAVVTVAVAEDSLPVADEVVSATVVDAAVVAVALATVEDEEAAVARPAEDVVLPAVVEVLAAVEVPVAERMSNLFQPRSPQV